MFSYYKQVSALCTWDILLILLRFFDHLKVLIVYKSYIFMYGFNILVFHEIL